MGDFIKLKWSLGLSPVSSSVFSLSSDAPLDIDLQNKTKILFLQGQNLVIYDDRSKEQNILSGHLNEVCSVAISEDKRFVISGGEWSESFPPAIIVWDLISKSDVRILQLAPEEGVAALALSKDSTHIAALIDVHEEMEYQKLRIWNWMDLTQGPVEIDLEKNHFHHNLNFSSFGDSHQIVSSGPNQGILWTYDPETRSLSSQVGTGFRDLEMVAVGALQETIFFSKGLLLSLSSTGFGVVWRLHDDHPPEPRKLLRLQGASCVHKWGNYLVVGFSDSMIRMYDQEFKIVTWNNDAGVGEIFSLSFAHVNDCGTNEVPECVVAGMNGINRVGFSSDSTVEYLMDWKVSDLISLAVHPNGDTICIGTQSGRIELWSLSRKELALTKSFASRHGEAPAVTCLEFSKCGEWLIAGFSDGGIKFLCMADDLESAQLFKSYSQPIAKIISAEGGYVAIMDNKDAVLAYRFFSRKKRVEGPSPKEWVLIGRQHAHKQPIQDITFSPHSPPRLFSVGYDCMIQEFSLDTGSLCQVGTTMGKGQMLSCIYVKDAPLSFGASKEDMLVTFTTDFKATFWNARRASRTPSATKRDEFNFFENEMQSVQNILGPAMGSPLARVSWVSKDLAIFSNLDRGLGLFRIPEFGWPVRTGTIATLSISSMKLLPNKTHVLTVGGNGLNLYQLIPECLDEHVSNISHDDYCVSILGQELIYQLKEAFLNVQGMEKSEDGNLGSISLSELRTIFRLHGNYLSQDAFDSISAEVSMQSENTRRGSISNIRLSFEEFLRIYTNHRNYCVSEKREATKCVDTLISLSPTKTLEKKEFLKLLSKKGDKMSTAEMTNTMDSLMGGKDLPEIIDGTFVEDLLNHES